MGPLFGRGAMSLKDEPEPESADRLLKDGELNTVRQLCSEILPHLVTQILPKDRAGHTATMSPCSWVTAQSPSPVRCADGQTPPLRDAAGTAAVPRRRPAATPETPLMCN